MRTLGMCLVALAACGNVSKQKPDAAVIVDAPLDAFDCTGHAPDASFTVLPMVPAPDMPATFTAATPGLSYAWTFPSGNPGASAALSPMVTWSTAGTYSVSLSVSDANHCTASSSQMVQVVGCAAAIPGPGLSMATTGWHDYGIAFQATRNTTLTGFAITNAGIADTIDLTDATGTVIQSVALPAGSPTYQAAVSWPLVANTTYHLINHTADNLKWASVTYPVTGASLSVTSAWENGSGVQSGVWFGFSNLVSCP